MNKTKLKIFFILVILIMLFISIDSVFAQNSSNQAIRRSTFSVGAFGGLGFSTLHKEEIEYEVYEAGSWNTRKTVSKPYFSYSLGIFSEIYLDTEKTFGLGLDISFTRMGYKDEIYSETFRTYYVIFTPKIISWTKKDFFVAAGWYWAILADVSKNASYDRIEKLDYGIMVEWGFFQASKVFNTRTGFKIYIGMKDILKTLNETDSRRGDIKGLNFAVHFYISFIFNLD